MLTTIGIIGSGCTPTYQAQNSGSAYYGEWVTNCSSKTKTRNIYQDYVLVDVTCGTGTSGGGTSYLGQETAGADTYTDMECQVTSANRYRTRTYSRYYCDNSIVPNSYSAWSSIKVGSCPSQ